MSFRKEISELSIKPHGTIVGAIDSKSFPLSSNSFFNYKPDFLASDEYKRCLSLFEKRIGNRIGSKFLLPGSEGYMEAMTLWVEVTQKISAIELSHKDKLVEIGENVIRRMYDIPDSVDLQGFIEEPTTADFNPTETQREDSEENWDNNGGLTDEQKEKVEEAAQKRVILNSLSHGSSVHIWKSAYHIVRDQIKELNPELISLYDDYSALVSLILWMYPAQFTKNSIEEGRQINQGYNKVEWDSDEDEEEDVFDDEMEEEYQKYLEEQGNEEDGITGMAVGINFPVLLHELNKSAFEILLMHSIPQDFSEEELMYYYAIADNYTEEVWHYYLGPTLWNGLLSAINETDHSVASVVTTFSNLSYKNLSDFCKFCIDDKEKAVERLNYMMDFFED